MWVGAWGWMSAKAIARSSSKTFFAGIAPLTILQNKQSIRESPMIQAVAREAAA
jgi:hypothetical protein